MRPYVASEFAAMSEEVHHRSLSGRIADLRVREGVPGNSSHGWQDKSADPGRAHVVGWANVFGASANDGAGAPARNAKQINATSAVACRPPTCTRHEPARR
jgi:hypothetical protein